MLTDGFEFGVVLGDAGLVEERDERLVGGLNQQELQGVAVESDALQRSKDSVQKGTTSD